MPTLSALVDSVYRDVADEAKAVFSQLQVEDFIRGGVAELNRVSPLDGSVTIAFTTDPDTGAITAYSYGTVITLPYRVELFRFSDGYTEPLVEPEPGQSVQGGWIFQRSATGGTISFPKWFLDSLDPSSYGVRVWGYFGRAIPYAATPSPQVSLSGEEEYSLRSYAKASAYDLLAHDRSLFAQWVGQSNNTDVSPTQMTQMAVNAKQDWNKQRGLIRTVRRYW